MITKARFIELVTAVFREHRLDAEVTDPDDKTTSFFDRARYMGRIPHMIGPGATLAALWSRRGRHGAPVWPIAIVNVRQQRHSSTSCVASTGNPLDARVSVC
jgi:hypothetical protein